MENKNCFKKCKNGSTILSKNASKTGVSTAAPWSGSMTLGNHLNTGVFRACILTGRSSSNNNFIVNSSFNLQQNINSLASGDRRLANLVNLQILMYPQNLTGVWEHAGSPVVQKNIQVCNCFFRRLNERSEDLLINLNNNFIVNKFSIDTTYNPRTLLA